MSSTLTPPRPAADPARLDLSRIAQDLQIRKLQVESVVQLLDEDNTVPFITRYRKERTGGLDEEVIRVIQLRVAQLRHLAERKQTILNSIEGQGKLTDELRQAIFSADSPKRLEDLYLPYKPKKRSLASDAREKGLGPLAEAIWTRDPAVGNLAEILPSMVNAEKGLNTPEDILLGVQHILAEVVAETADIRSGVRFFLWDHATLVTSKSEKVKESEGLDYKDYFEFKEPIRTVPPHRILAINRGEKEKALQVKLESDAQFILQIALDKLPLADHPHAEFLRTVTADAMTRLLIPSLEREIRRELKERSEDHAVSVFARNLRSLLLAPPLRHRRVLAVDPAFRTGCKLAALDETGNLIEETVIFPHPPQKKRTDSLIKLEEMIRKHRIQVIAIGNGTACRETEDVVAELLGKLANPAAAQQPSPPVPADNPPAVADTPPTAPPVATDTPPVAADVATGEPPVAGAEQPTGEPPVAMVAAPETPPAPPPPPKPDPAAVLIGLPAPQPDLAYIIVNEAGASEYSASPIGKEEFPNFDASLRGAISIGRRLQDPLSELVKIDAQHVGVGLYQHDVDRNHLKASLEGVIESCVNQVGVDLNTASAPLLRYVSGLDSLAASNLVEYRKAQGAFRTREQLMQVSGIGPKKYTQAAGFLKIVPSDEPLDQTWIHPESYHIARQVLQELGYSTDVLNDRERVAELREKLKTVPTDDIATRLGVGTPTCRDIIDALARPGRDPREDLPPPIFKKGILKLEDLQSGMELKGTVLNVVDFGAFVDIGLKDSGLVHISRMANRYVKSPYDVVSVGDVVTVWVLSVDNERRRVSLTMIQPGTERKPPERRGPPPREGRPPREGAPPAESQQPQAEPRPAPPRRPQAPPPRGGERQLPPRGVPRQGQGQGRGPRPGQVQGQGRGAPPPRHGTPASEGAAQGQTEGAKSPPPPPRKPKRSVAKPNLSKAALAGKESLGTFAELAVFWEEAGKPPEAPTAAPAPEATPQPETPPPEQPRPEGEQATPAP